jgi:two-component system cell cycle sensor histidine kinase/response regulator CckA
MISRASAATILVVEDNPITRKQLRVTLATNGFRVVEAADAATALSVASAESPDVIVQDMLLPDSDGFALAANLRKLPGGSTLPIILCTGSLAGDEEMRAAATFAAVLIKPVENERLVETVRAAADWGQSVASLPGRGKRVIVADDDRVQLKLVRLQLMHLGFDVEAVVDGQAALDAAKANPPDAIVSDVLMPRMDGFRLCHAVRKDPALSRTKVVLQSCKYTDEADRDLATRIGADAYLARTPDSFELAEVLLSTLQLRTRPPYADEEGGTYSEYLDRVVDQLERQSAQNEQLAARYQHLASALSVLGATSEALAIGQPSDDAIRDTLYRCIDAAGISAGIIYLCGDAGGMRVHTVVGYRHDAGGEADQCFGHPEFLETACQSGASLRVPSDGVPRAAAGDFLSRLGFRNALIMPIAFMNERLGSVLLASNARTLLESDWTGFAKILAGQVGQAIALSRAFNSLRESERRYRDVFEGSPVSLYVTDIASGRILSANSAMSTTYGYDMTELLALDGKRLLASATGSQPDEGSDDFQRHRRKDGAVLEVEQRSTDITYEGKPARLVAANDVTERRVLEQKLIQAQKMEAVGRLAGGFAHDFNNQLTAISGFAEIICDALPTNDPQREDVDEIKMAAQRAAELARRLLTFSRQQPTEARVVDMNSAVGDLERMLRRTIGEDIELAVELADDDTPVLIDPVQLEQVIVNLVVNARDATGPGGRVIIRTRHVPQEAVPASIRRPDIGSIVALTVADNGCGMTDDVKSRIFEPFFTTKQVGRGTGLGLATVDGIVKECQGWLDVASEVGKGSTFTLYLRLATPVGAAASITNVVAVTAPVGQTVLIAEDDPSVRGITRRMLERAGYRVREATDALKAREVIAREIDIDILVSDVVMPGTSGQDLVQLFRSWHPDGATILMSGHTNEAVLRRGPLPPGTQLLPKPFTSEALLGSVRKALVASRSEATAA